MASITIRNIEKEIKTRLRIQAARHGRSMEEEARNILSETLSIEPVQSDNLAEMIRNRFAPLGGIDLPELSREPMREPVEFEK